MKESKEKINIFKLFKWMVFVMYLALLINVVVLKSGSSYAIATLLKNQSWSQRISGVNFIPFKTISEYLGGDQSFRIIIRNIFGNILAFGPMGFLLPTLANRFSKLKNIIIISLLVSLSIEIVQFIYRLGSSDIDDIILNVIGAILGFAVYKKALALYHSDKCVEN